MSTRQGCRLRISMLICLLMLCGHSGYAATFLIITADEFIEPINDLAEWKYMRGLPTRVVPLTEINPSGSPTKQEIKDYISQAYYTWVPTPEYVLLVGDTVRIPRWYVGEPYYVYSDNPYGDITGNCIAEIAVGRFATSTVDKCETMVAKTLACERLSGIESCDWLQKATLVLREDVDGNEPYYATLECLGTIFTDFGYDPVDSLIAYYNGTGDDSSDVIDAIDNGRSFVIYRGSSLLQCWRSPMTVLESQLHNGWQLPIVINGTCATGNFGQPTAMCNTWTQAGSALEPRGAVAFLAPSTYVSSAYFSWSRHYATVGIIEAVFWDEHTLLGDAFVCGKNNMYYAWGGAIDDRTREYLAWSLIGDPTLQIWTSVPCSMTVEHVDAIERAVPYDLTVSVCEATMGQPLQDALVTLYKNSGTTPEIFESDSTDSYGNAFFEGIVVPNTGIVNVTVTYHQGLSNCFPYQGRIVVLQMLTDDASALSSNGNRHLVRTPNTEELHLVYTRGGEVVYRCSSDGGVEWSLPETVGAGKFPAIALASDDLPSVAWTDVEGGLWYRRKTSATTWSEVYHLDDPASSSALHLNSPPAIAIDPVSRPNMVHILATRSGLRPRQTYAHRLEDFSFAIDNPYQGSFELIEQKLGPMEPPLRTFPSIARCEVNNSLHAVWQRQDTICYAVKPGNDPWTNWGPQFLQQGRQSAHPCVETYGDSVFVVWQHLDPATQKEEVLRGARHISYSFGWTDFSQISDLVSLDPVNASGFFTTYAEEPTMDSPFDIYYKVRASDDRINVSNTSGHSRYPQSAARFTPAADFQYTAWLEGEETPYEIKFRKMQHLDPEGMAYLSSSNGQSAASPYLASRDGFIDSWQIPVDIGSAAITYRFPLLPGYVYKAKAVVYHEATGSWSGRLKCDNNLLSTVTYNANVPETLECWIPPALYADSVLTVSFERVAGAFAAIGPIYIYRYELDAGEAGGGPMSQDGQIIGSPSIAAFPNPFRKQLTIACQTAGQHNIELKVYDVTGRLVKQFDVTGHESFNHVIWDGLDDKGRAVPQGIYFLRVDNSGSGDMLCQKVLRVQ